MTIEIEDILRAVCSSVKQTLSNDFQKVFVLSSASEAKLAFEILVAHGLDVKSYPQENNTAKLYVTHPTATPGQLENALSAAKAYAATCKEIKTSLDTLCGDGTKTYSMTFANLHPSSKQIVVQISPASGAPTPILASAPAQNTPTSQAASSAQTVVKRRVMKAKGHYEELSSGPAVGRGTQPGAVAADGTVPKESLKRRIMLYMFGNIAVSSYAMLIMVVILGVIFSIAVFAKGFLCPDFVSMKRNTAWYCKNASDEDEKERQKQQRQQQLGIQPQQR